MEQVLKSVGAVLTTGNGLCLLQKRDSKPTIYFPNLIGLFGGAVDENESFEAAMQRELQEELSILLDLNRFNKVLETRFISHFLGSSVPRHRVFYHVHLTDTEHAGVRLKEGQAIFEAAVISLPPLTDLVPTDAFALGIVANKITGQQIYPNQEP